MYNYCHSERLKTKISESGYTKPYVYLNIYSHSKNIFKINFKVLVEFQ